MSDRTLTPPPSTDPSTEWGGQRPRQAPQTGAAQRIGSQRLAAYHDFTRRKGVNWPLYTVARLILLPFFLIYFRLSRQGRSYAKHQGALIVAANHRSFLDPFVIAAGLPFRRPMSFVAKVELFEKRWQGWVLNRLGAYPVCRGEADEDTVATTRAVLDRGGVICIFPEGTRIRSGSLAAPHRGVGRLALETGSAVLPTAVIGTEYVRNGWRIRPRKVKVRMGKAMTFPRTEHPSPQLAATITSRIWPNVELQWEWLGGLPPMRKAAVIGAGSYGTAVAVLLARAGLDVQLGCRTAETAELLAGARVNERYLPGIELGEGIAIRRAADIELAGVDLVCLAVPSAALPTAVAQIGDKVGERTAVLLLSKGLVPPIGTLPSIYVTDRVRARAIATLGGPAHAKEAALGTAALVLASDDDDLRAQLGDAFDRSGLVCERTTDVIGVEMAGVAKNASALAAAAAEGHGLNAAGIAAAEIWRECIDFALDNGGHLETFSGLAGVGDLMATVMAPGSRNRRAGELLGQGVPAAEIPGQIGQASEALDTVPLLAATVSESGVPSEGLEGLASLIEGEIDTAEWINGLRRAESARQAA